MQGGNDGGVGRNWKFISDNKFHAFPPARSQHVCCSSNLGKNVAFFEAKMTSTEWKHCFIYSQFLSYRLITSYESKCAKCLLISVCVCVAQTLFFPRGKAKLFYVEEEEGKEGWKQVIKSYTHCEIVSPSSPKAKSPFSPYPTKLSSVPQVWHLKPLGALRP